MPPSHISDITPMPQTMISLLMEKDMLNLPIISEVSLHTSAYKPKEELEASKVEESEATPRSSVSEELPRCEQK